MWIMEQQSLLLCFHGMEDAGIVISVIRSYGYYITSSLFLLIMVSNALQNGFFFFFYPF